jgi:hypothetical protein
MKNFHNTTQESGQLLLDFSATAQHQEKIVLWFFAATNKSHTPSAVWMGAFNKTIPLTSVRRALSNLAKQGHLTRTAQKTTGIYGRPEHYWQFND